MSGLVEKLEAAEAGSREFDGLVEVAIRDVFASRSGLKQEHWAKWRSNAAGFVSDGYTTYASDPVTTSLDAALALAERVCPDHDWSVGCLPVSDDADYEEHHHFGALLYSRYTKPYDALGHGATPALALCIAICRALNLNETRHD